MFDLRLLFVAVVWGVNFSAVKLALADFHPLGFTMIRFGLAAVFLIAVMLVTREPLAIERGDRFAIIKLGFIGITLFNIFFMYGLKYTTVANSALLVSLSPLFGALISAAWGKERLTVRAGAGLALSTAGVFLIIRSHYGDAGFLLRGNRRGSVDPRRASHLGGLYRVRKASAGKIFRRQDRLLQHVRRMRPASAPEPAGIDQPALDRHFRSSHGPPRRFPPSSREELPTPSGTGE